LTKIVSFMTWLEAFGPLLGRFAPPRIGDLLDGRRAGYWFILYYSGVGLGTVSLAIEAVGIFRAAALVCLTGSLGVVAELIRVRRLAEIAPAKRPPGGGLPRLFLPQA